VEFQGNNTNHISSPRQKTIIYAGVAE